MVDEISKMMLKIKPKQNHKIKSKILKYIVNIKLSLYKKWLAKKVRKRNIAPKQKMEDTFFISCTKYTGNSDMSSKTIKDNVKLLKTIYLKCEHDKSMFLKHYCCYCQNLRKYINVGMIMTKTE